MLNGASMGSVTNTRDSRHIVATQLKQRCFFERFAENSIPNAWPTSITSQKLEENLGLHRTLGGKSGEEGRDYCRRSDLVSAEWNSEFGHA